MIEIVHFRLNESLLEFGLFLYWAKSSFCLPDFYFSLFSEREFRLKKDYMPISMWKKLFLLYDVSCAWFTYFSGTCIRNCAQCEKMYGPYFDGELCGDACIKFKGKIIPDCDDIVSVAPFLNKMNWKVWTYGILHHPFKWGIQVIFVSKNSKGCFIHCTVVNLFIFSLVLLIQKCIAIIFIQNTIFI